MNTKELLTGLILLVLSSANCFSESPKKRLDSFHHEFATDEGLTHGYAKIRRNFMKGQYFSDSIFSKCIPTAKSESGFKRQHLAKSEALNIAAHIFSDCISPNALLTISVLSLIHLSMLALGAASGIFAIGGILLALVSLNRIRKSNQKNKGRLVAFSILIAGVLLLILGIASAVALMDALS